VAVVRDFEFNGRQYFAPKTSKESAEVFTVSGANAKQLCKDGKVTIVRGGYCDRLAVRIDDITVLNAFLPWDLSPSAVSNTVGQHPDAFDDVLLRVELCKYIQVIPTVNLRPGDQFFLQWKLIRTLSYQLEGDGQPLSGALMIFADQKPYEPAANTKT